MSLLSPPTSKKVDGPGPSRWAHSRHEVFKSQRWTRTKRCDSHGRAVTLVALEAEEGAMSQGTQVPLESGKGKERGFPWQPGLQPHGLRLDMRPAGPRQ